LKEKIALFTNVPTDAVITAKDVKSIYEVPVLFHKEGLDDKILQLLNIWTGAPRMKPWEDLVKKIKNPKHHVIIGIIGKYVDLTESYKSLHEALVHGGIANDGKVELRYVSADELEEEGSTELLEGCHGILVPGGFGKRGIEGKIMAVNYARTNKVPFFGICLGMQLAVVEFARNNAGMEDAHSTEFNKNTKHPVIYLMKEWYDYRTKQVQVRDENSDYGGTMRLGSYPCNLHKSTFALAAYKENEIQERHRHRYEFNPDHRNELVESGLVISGTSPDDTLVEIIEIKDHPWFLGCQFHPEFKSKPMKPHPLFRDFIKAALQYSQEK
jgi:CTP synthase